MEQNIPLILCKLERIFPPTFFDSMEHLLIHLAYEVRLSGPVQYRWMYPFERQWNDNCIFFKIHFFNAHEDDLVFFKICRFMSNSKRAVKNKAQVEGSICASYAYREMTYFCSHYFNNFMLSPHNVRNQIAIEAESHPPMLSVFD